MTDPFRHHGGNLAAARARYGDGAWLDLSTGINPDAWPIPPDLAIDPRPLPDPAALSALEAAAAAHFGVPLEHVCAVPGSEMGLRLLRPLLGAQGRHQVPGYRTHAAVFADSTPWAPGAAMAHGDSLVLANPNNPCGTLRTPDALIALLDERKANGGWLVVDEAFVDPHPDASIASLVEDERRLIVLRSFGKFFGMAGLRLGFVVAPRAVIAGYRALLGDWPIDATALAIGTAAYRDARWIAATRAALPARAAALDTFLQAHGLTPIGQSPLFRLVECADAPALFERLATVHILVRPFDAAPHQLRFGVPHQPAALDRLDRALRLG